MIRSHLTGLMTAGLLFTGLPAAAAAPPPAPLYTAGPAVPGEYVVVLKPGASTLAGPLAVAEGAGGDVRRTYGAALRGFHASLPAAAVEKLRRDPSVAFVQTNQIHQQPIASSGSQSNAPWHLDRIDQRHLPLNSTYNYPDDGAGVNVYVIDSGVRATHNEFEGRATGV